MTAKEKVRFEETCNGYGFDEVSQKEVLCSFQVIRLYGEEE